MEHPRIDPDALRRYLRSLPKHDVYRLLDKALDLIPAADLHELVEDHIHPRDLAILDTAPRALLEQVREFDALSRMGSYYEEFDVDSRNCTQLSRGTEAWITDCQRLLDRCCKAGREGQYAEARSAFDLVFDLLLAIDRGSHPIIFFADEGGSWQVGVNWREVVPAWLRCLAETAAPSAYADAVVHAAMSFAWVDADDLLLSAQRIASDSQHDALAALSHSTQRGVRVPPHPEP